MLIFPTTYYTSVLGLSERLVAAYSLKEPSFMDHAQGSVREIRSQI